MARLPDTRPTGAMSVLLAVRFVAELGMLAELVWAGWYLSDSALRVVLAVVLPVLAALAWGRWVAPRSSHRLADPPRAGVELLLFAGAFVLVTQADPYSVGWALPVLLAYAISMPARRVRV